MIVLGHREMWQAGGWLLGEGGLAILFAKLTLLVHCASPAPKLCCNFELLEVPWKNTAQLLKHDCVQV